MDLSAYLRRIGYGGPLRPDRETLFALHRAHMLAIPYENLDVQFGRRLSTDVAEAYDKIVNRGRGGWCYEMNGLFGWALKEAGFCVTRLAGEVMPQERDPDAMGGHLVLRVDLDEPWLADVGFGDGLVDPIPLQAGEYVQGAHLFRLEEHGPELWRLHNHADASARYFDFQSDAADEAVLIAACERQQTSPTSTFVLNLVCQRHTRYGVSLLLGRVFHRADGGPKTVTILDTAEDLVSTLATEFGIEVPAAAGLWPRVCERHAALFPPS